MKSTTLNQDVGEFVCIVTARKNTWSHSRRKRRQEKFKLSNPPSDTDNTGDGAQPPRKIARVDPEAKGSSGYDDSSSSSEEKPLIMFSLELKVEGIHIKLSLTLIDCDQKDMLHQILQHFKNKLQ